MGILKRLTFSFISSVSLSACSVFGIRSGVPEVPFTIIDQIGPVEIRSYGPRTVVEVTDGKDTSEAFFMLFDYISGGNTEKREISMTAPVEVREEGQTIAMTAPVQVAKGSSGNVAMRFFLPADFTKSSSPIPRNPRVKLAELPPELFAAIRYSGRSTDEKFKQKSEQIKAGLERSKWVIAGEPNLFGFDPPYTIPFLRRNEVMIKVDESKD